MQKLAFNIGEELWLKKDQGIAKCVRYEIDLITNKRVCIVWESSSGYSSIGELISTILPNIYVIAGVILFFLMVGGGLMIVVSAGQDNPEGTAKGKKAVTSALIGFLLIFASYWIMQIIQTVTGIKFFESGL